MAKDPQMLDHGVLAKATSHVIAFFLPNSLPSENISMCYIKQVSTGPGDLSNVSMFIPFTLQDQVDK